MDPTAPEFEELMLCGYCKQKYNDTDQSPKLLSCKHYFCLQCVRTALNKGGQELYCVHCWKRTELAPDMGPESLPTYAPVLCLTKNFAQLKLSTNGPGGGGGGGGGAPPGGGTSGVASNGPGTTAGQSGGLKLVDGKQSVQQTKMISENCHTHAMPLALWCQTCCAPICRACAQTSEHTAHHVKSQNETKDQLAGELHLELQTMQKMLNEIQRLAVQQREFLLKILEACVTLKTHVEADLTNNASHCEFTDIRDLIAKVRMNLSMVETLGDVQSLYATVNTEKQRIQMRYQEMYLQCQLDDLIRNSNVVFDFGLLKQALTNIHNGEIPFPANTRLLTSHQNPILFLANYCMSQLYSRHVIAKQINGNIDYHHQNHTLPPPHPPAQSIVAPQPQLSQSYHPVQQGHLMLPPPTNKNIYPPDNVIVQSIIHSPQIPRTSINICPHYYFNIDVNGAPMGRIVIEVRADVAPKMAKNFGLLSTGEIGMGYKGCSIFQCWEGESVITGDFEMNNGRGGRSIFEESYFLPDDTKLLATRGTVGMRRTQKRHDNLGMVGSQFRIILQEMRGFTGIFGHVVEGLELVEKISTYGDTAGKPTKTIVISKCGKL